MKETHAFDEAYAKLNSAQKDAVDSVYGPVMVVAGPGTGKTQILAVRIANILKNVAGAQADEIVALTYTESAVTSMRTRLASLIGAAAYRVRIHTFHGFARLILELRPDLFPRIATGTQLNEVSSITLMETLLDAGSYTIIRNPRDPYRLAKKLVHFISLLKREHKTPEGYKAELLDELALVMNDPERVHEKGAHKGKEKVKYKTLRQKLEKHLEVADLYANYEKTLEEKNLFDFDDLIREAVRGLESNEDFRLEVGERMQFVLADEHQDANPAQNRLLELVTDFDGAPNLFVVGDEKQAIYRFQGASLASFFYFKEAYPDAKIIVLGENYRSTSQILDAAHDLMEPAPIPYPQLRVPLIPTQGSGPRITLAPRDTPTEEMHELATYSTKLASTGVPYSDIAILTRTNRDVLTISDYLRSVGIPEDHASAELDALSHPAVRLFIDLLRAVSDPRNSGALGRALFIPGFPAPLTERLKALGLARDRKPLAEILPLSHPDIASWWRNVSYLSEQLRTTPALAWIANLASVSGFLGGILSMNESEDAYSAYEAFMEEVRIVAKTKPSATALEVLEHIDLIESHELSIKRARTKRAGVSVMTAHHAKGMEFPYVAVAFASDERWLGKRAQELSLFLKEEDEDEHDVRRLFYVALTRAKKEVLVTYSLANDDARAQTPLRFLADISAHIDESVASEKAPLPVAHSAKGILDPNFLRERFLSQGFSPTGFNNYMKSPWLYLFRSLLQIPDAPNKYMQYGTAIHAGLKYHADSLKKEAASTEKTIQAFTQELERLAISDSDREGLRVQGTESLTTYLSECGEDMKHVKESEFPVTIPFEIPEVGTIAIAGKIDRIDGEGTHVTVIDYKTGKVKSENEIRGLTKDADGGYYRQLVFYKLMLERDGRHLMTKGALHFVEPNDSGKIIVREFVITQEEVKELEREIAEAGRAIVSGEAFATLPDPKDVPEYSDIISILKSRQKD